MATKSKKSNQLIKFFCILLSVICVAGSAYFVENIAGAAYSYQISFDDFNGKPMQKQVKDSNKLSQRVYEDVRNVNYQMALQDKAALKKQLQKSRTKYVTEVLGEFITQQKDFNAMIREEGDYSNEELYFVYDYMLDYDDGVNLISFTIQINEDDKLSFADLDENTAEKKISAVFDKFINADDFKSYANDDYQTDISLDAAIYAVNKKKGISYNTEDSAISAKEALSNPYSFVVKNGKVTCGKELDGIFDESIAHASTPFMNDCEYCFYVKNDSGSNTSYAADIDEAERTKDVNLLNCAVWGSILLFLAVLLAIISFVLCGKRDRNGKIKLAFIDRVPVDLHLVLSGGIVTGLTCLFAFLYEIIIGYAYPFENYLYYCEYALCALIWAVFIEFMTSFIRVCKSEKKLYKSTLIYLVIKYLIIKPWGFVFGKIKASLEYKPMCFNKSLKKGLIGYGALNAFLIFVMLCCAGADSAGGACFFFGVSIIVNIVILVYAVRYMINLDKIITAAHYRQVPQVDYNKLPNSLKTLVNSLNYTRQELNNAVAQAVKDEHMRTELITNVSHDLKTPLTSVITYVDLLKKCDITDENAKEYIEVLDEKSIRLKRLIDDLIEASKITSGVININPVNLNLSELATQAVVEHQQEFEENGLSLVFTGDKSTIGAFADGSKTYRVIQNLLSNARKYSLKGTRVYADVYETQNYSIFEVKNTSSEALNITPEELKERFVRGDKSRANEGNGLGLSIADNLCKAQNGHLNITIDGDLFKAQVMLPKSK
ncbi:MAG: HAMP domain-containing histidine kinase [Eubacterium sp.]|nr:HAMP domain-containing histidine kinase [Eubacterium sp.]